MKKTIILFLLVQVFLYSCKDKCDIDFKPIKENSFFKYDFPDEINSDYIIAEIISETRLRYTYINKSDYTISFLKYDNRSGINLLQNSHYLITNFEFKNQSLQIFSAEKYVDEQNENLKKCLKRITDRISNETLKSISIKNTGKQEKKIEITGKIIETNIYYISTKEKIIRYRSDEIPPFGENNVKRYIVFYLVEKNKTKTLYITIEGEKYE